MKDVISCVRQLVQIPSLSGEEKELAHFIRDSLNDFGLDKVYIDELGDVIGIVRGKSNRPLIVLEGHMDHVSPGNPELWKYPPYSAKIADGKIYGRGTVDMKASLAAMMFASKEIAQKENEGTLALCFVVHEETAEGEAIKHIVENELKEFPDLVVLGEATSLNLAIGHRGRAVIKVELIGKTAHASMPELGLNALHAAAKIITNIEQDVSQKLPFHPKLGKASITTINLDASPKNLPQLPDRAEIIFDRRTIVGENEEDVVKPIKEKVEELVKEKAVLDGTANIVEEEICCWTGKKLKVKNFFPSWLIEEEREIVQNALKSLHSAGLPSRIYTWRFSTDGVYTCGLRQIPTIGMGPGDEALAHQPNENIAIDKVEKAVEAYLTLTKAFI